MKAQFVFVSLLLAGMFRALAVPGPSGPNPAVPVKRSWHYAIEEIAERGVSSDRERVFVATAAARVDAVAAQNGEKLWSSELGGETASNLLAGDTSIFVATIASGNGETRSAVQVRSLSKDTGITNWSSSISDAGPVSAGLAGENLIIVSRAGRVIALNVGDGREIWNTKIADAVHGEPAFDGERVAVSAGGTRVAVLSAKTGAVEDTVRSVFTPTALAFIGDGCLMLGDERGNLSAYDLDKNEMLWNLKAGARISSILGTSAAVVVASSDNFVYLVDPGSGHINWKKRQAGQPARLAALPDGKRVIVSDFAGESVTMLSLKSGKAVEEILPVGESDFIRFGSLSRDTLIVSTSDGITAYETGDEALNVKTAGK